MSATSDLEKRIQALEDIEAIKQLKARWWLGCDIQDLEMMGSCYAREFLIDFGFLGQYRDIDQFLQMFKEHACLPTHVDVHHGMAPQIEIVDENHAKGRWRMQFQKLETEKNMVQLMAGIYEDEYIREDGQWKMNLTKYTIISNLMLQANDNGLEVVQIGSQPGLVTQE